MADENLNIANEEDILKTDAIITDEAKDALNIMLGFKDGKYDSAFTKEAKEAILAMLKMDDEVTYDSFLSDDAIKYIKAILDIKKKESENVPTSSINVIATFNGISNLPSTFAITNDFNDNVFTLENAVGTDSFSWTLSNVPINTQVIFTETGIQMDNYTLRVNDLDISEDAYSEMVMSTENTIVAIDFVNVYTTY